MRKHLFGDDVELVNVDRAEDIDVDATENSNVSQTVVDISNEGILVSERIFPKHFSQAIFLLPVFGKCFTSS